MFFHRLCTRSQSRSGRRLTNYAADDVGIVADLFRLAQAAGLRLFSVWLRAKPSRLDRRPGAARRKRGGAGHVSSLNMIQAS
jgi:hypothetical protein